MNLIKYLYRNRRLEQRRAKYFDSGCNFYTFLGFPLTFPTPFLSNIELIYNKSFSGGGDMQG